MRDSSDDNPRRSTSSVEEARTEDIVAHIALNALSLTLRDLELAIDRRIR
jgi:hypothetical protein